MAATRFVRTTVRRGTILVVLLSLTSCAFEPSITPIAWPTVGRQPLSGTPLVPQPSPIPIAPTPSPQPPEPRPFRGWEDLDCGDLRGGDNRFGYCDIPGTDTYYVWGPCRDVCPEGSYPGVELWIVSESFDLFEYIMLVDQRDDARDDIIQGFGLGRVCRYSGIRASMHCHGGCHPWDQLCRLYRDSRRRRNSDGL